MITIFENKHFSITINPQTLVVDESGKRINIQFDYTKHSTRATKFQIKKTLARVVRKALVRGIEEMEKNNGATVRGNKSVESDT
jgi:hypothetical protein